MKKLFCLSALVLFAATSALAADGESLFRASCAGCHGVDGSKAAGGTTPLKNQNAEELLKKLQGYTGDSYGGKQKQIMQNIIRKHGQDELKQLAEYAAKL